MVVEANYYSGPWERTRLAPRFITRTLPTQPPRSLHARRAQSQQRLPLTLDSFRPAQHSTSTIKSGSSNPPSNSTFEDLLRGRAKQTV